MLPWDVEDLIFDETRFSGVARLFPLPDLVMFPHVMQPLHIFEPRYRAMLNDALDSDGLIAMSVLSPGWESDYDGRPTVFPQLCLGKVVTHQRLEDGRYNIMLLGMRRARVTAECPATRSFRRAEVEVLDEVYPVEGEATRAEVHNELSRRFQQALPINKNEDADSPVRELLASELPLGVLTDLVSFALPLPMPLKLELLAECDVDRRAALLLDALGAPARHPAAATRPAKPAGFPPRFSWN
ncbi:MAG: LON peptidase substrate-binding domain-containing protein [Pirellulales bacterium]|nr:LON peptidase substrate-binding domain-containing protein [Pirellulales bacterium]